MEIDASEIIAFAERLGASTGDIDGAMQRATQVALLEGLGYAQEYAPIDEGTLRNSIGILEMSGWGGRYGTSLEYAWQREEGGTIVGNPWLVFQVNGRWVKVRSVTQSGSKYMERSATQLEGRLEGIYGRVIEQMLAGL